MRARSREARSFGLTVPEAEKLRSLKVCNMGIKFLLLTQWIKSGIKHENRTRIGQVLLSTGDRFSNTIEIEDAYVVKLRQFRSDFNDWCHFVISESREEIWYPYCTFSTTSIFRPPVQWGQTFWPLAIGRAWPQRPQIWHGTLEVTPTACIKRWAWLDNFLKIGTTLAAGTIESNLNSSINSTR